MRAGITHADIEAKLRQIQGEVDTTANAAMPAALTIGAVVVVGLAGAAYAVGQRSAKKRTTVVEVRRV